MKFDLLFFIAAAIGLAGASFTFWSLITYQKTKNINRMFDHIMVTFLWVTLWALLSSLRYITYRSKTFIIPFVIAVCMFVIILLCIFIKIATKHTNKKVNTKKVTSEKPDAIFFLSVFATVISCFAYIIAILILNF